MCNRSLGVHEWQWTPYVKYLRDVAQSYTSSGCTYIVGDAVDGRSADEDSARSEGESLDDVSSESYTTVQVDLATAIDSRHDLAQCVQLEQTMNSFRGKSPRTTLIHLWALRRFFELPLVSNNASFGDFPPVSSESRERRWDWKPI